MPPRSVTSASSRGRGAADSADTALLAQEEGGAGGAAAKAKAKAKAKPAVKKDVRESPVIFKGKHGEIVTDYNATSLSSFAVFLYWKGTVLTHRSIWIEMAVYLVLFLLGMLVMIFWKQVYEDVWNDVVSPTVAFVRRISVVMTFLLGFYVSQTYDRWWRTRTEGIGRIWSGASQAVMLLSHYVRDDRVLDAIARYARASLHLVFIHRRFQEKAAEGYVWLVEDEILNQEEVDKLKAWDSNLSESVWNWSLTIVMSLRAQGVVKSDEMHQLIVEKILLGRSGAQVINEQLNTPIPMIYVHLLSAMVKLYSIMVSFWNGCAYGLHLSTAPYLIETFLLIFLFNSLLIISDILSDPFDGDLSDFPMDKYQQVVRADARSYIDATRSLPNWIASMPTEARRAAPSSASSRSRREEPREPRPPVVQPPEARPAPLPEAGDAPAAPEDQPPVEGSS